MKTHNLKLKIHFTKHFAHEFSLIGGGDGMGFPKNFSIFLKISQVFQEILYITSIIS